MEQNCFRANKLNDIKRIFSQQFPYLKLEFMGHIQEKRPGKVVQEKMTGNTRFNRVAGHGIDPLFSYTASTTVADFKQQLGNTLRLLVQVYRRDGVMWIQTTGTDHLSLEKQNKMGEVASRPMTFNLNNLFL